MLEKRAERSNTIALVSPLIAIGLTIVTMSILFAILGKNPISALGVYFIEPLTDSYSLQEIAVKATPLVMIAIGLSLCYLANAWNIGAEGQFLIGAVAGSWLAVKTQGTDAGYWVLPAMLLLGAVAGALYALIPAICKVKFGASEILTSLMLVYVADLFLDYLVRGPWRDPKGFNFPTTAEFDPVATVPVLIEGGRLHLGAVIALVVVAAGAVLLGKTIKGFEIRVVGAAPRAARFGGFNSNQLILLTFAISGALAGLAGIIEVAGPVGHLQPGISPGYGFTAIIVAFLGRLNPIGILIAGLFLALTFIGGEQAQIAMKIPLDVTKVFQGILLFYVLACDSLILYRFQLIFASPTGGPMGLVEAIILAVLAASTPLLLAATGELVTERAGVLNLGVEGMMIVGAACGFGGAWLTGSVIIGALCGIVAGMLLSLIFALMTLGLAVNQVATGLALTILGVGLSGLIGARFVGERITPAPHLHIPGLTDIPLVGRILFGEDAFVYLSLALVVGVWFFLYRTRAGLILRAVGDNHALRACARLSRAADPDVRGDVRRRLRGPRRRLSAARLYAVLHSGHDRRARLDRAGAGRVRVLAAGPARDRRLSVRRGHDPAAACAGLGHRRSLAIHVGIAVSRDRHRPGPDFARANRRLDCAGGARDRVRARPVNMSEARATGRARIGKDSLTPSVTGDIHEKDSHRGSRSDARRRSRPVRRVRRRQAQGRIHLSRPGRRSRLDLSARPRPPGPGQGIRRQDRDHLSRERQRRPGLPSARSSSWCAPATS